MVDLFLRYLKAEETSVIFGVPGGLLHPFFVAVDNDPDFTLIVAKHEQGAAFMADGYARTSGRLAVCAGTGGPGTTNLFTGVSVAFADGVPMLVVTGQAASHAMGRGAAQETTPEDIDIVAMLRPVTKYSVMVRSPERFAHHLRRALRQALSGRPGPVHINVPVDFWLRDSEEEWFEPASYRPETTVFDRAAVARASTALLEASYPVILAGSGVASSHAREHLVGLAEMVGARVATSPRAKGVFPEDHPSSLGVLGFAGHAAAVEALLGEQVDCLMVVGASLNEATTFNWNPKLAKGRRIIQLDIDVDRIARNYPVDIALVGDAQTIVVELLYHLHRMLREGLQSASKWADEKRLVRTGAWYASHELRESDQTPVAPQRWRAELDEVLPHNAIVFSDIGGHMLFNIQHLCIRAQQDFVLNLGFGSMGHGTAAPIGAAMAHPERPVVAIVGDACFTMNGMELLTAAEYDIPVVWIVENNQRHGITWHGSALLGDKLDSVIYRRPLEVAGIARAMGLHAAVVERPNQMSDVFREALERGVPAVIEVKVDPEIPPPMADRARSIAGFKNA